MRDMANTPERRLEALEAAQFRTGSDLADLRTEAENIFNETRGLADWTAREAQKGDARYEKVTQRLADLNQELDFIRSDIDTMGSNIRSIMRHLGIQETE